MIQLLPQNDTLTPVDRNPVAAVQYINDYIDKHSCENMSVDISFLNVIDACHVSTLCSTKHYIKYPNGKINWKIPSELVSSLNESLNLGNALYEV